MLCSLFTSCCLISVAARRTPNFPTRRCCRSNLFLSTQNATCYALCSVQRIWIRPQHALTCTQLPTPNLYKNKVEDRLFVYVCQYIHNQWGRTGNIQEMREVLSLWAVMSNILGTSVCLIMRRLWMLVWKSTEAQSSEVGSTLQQSTRASEVMSVCSPPDFLFLSLLERNTSFHWLHSSSPSMV